MARDRVCLNHDRRGTLGAVTDTQRRIVDVAGDRRGDRIIDGGVARVR